MSIDISATPEPIAEMERLGNEIAARFYAARGLATIADAYLRNALDCCRRWGADGKVRQLEELHPHLRQKPALRPYFRRRTWEFSGRRMARMAFQMVVINWVDLAARAMPELGQQAGRSDGTSLLVGGTIPGPDRDFLGPSSACD